MTSLAPPALPTRPPRRSTSWRGSGLSLYLPTILLSLVLICLIVPPILVLVQSSLAPGEGSAGGLTLANYVKLFSAPGLYVSVFNSVVFAAAATALSLLAGAALAWIVERTNAPFRALAYVTTIISLGTPTILYVNAWQFLLGRAGPFNSAYRALFGTDENLFNVFTLPGMVFVEGTLWVPLSFLLMSATFKRQNAELEEAARMSGAGVIDTVVRVSLRLALPAILGLALFIFIRNLEAFDVPVLLGTPGGISLLTSDIYLSMTRVPPDIGHASAFSVILILVVSVLLYYYGRLSQNADQFASITGKGFRPRRFDLGPWRWMGGAIILVIFLITLALPLLAIAWNSLMPFTRGMTLAGLGSITFKHYSVVLSDPFYLDLAFNTVVVAVAAATGAMLLTALTAWFSVRKWPGYAILEQLVSIPLVFPGVVLGVAMIQVALRSPLPLYGTLWIISIAFVIRYMPYGMRYSHSGVLQIHRELEEAAGVAGASQRRIFFRIVAPLLSPALISGWLFIFLLGAKELSIAVLLSGVRNKTIAVAMFDQWTNGQAGEVAALGMVWTLLMSIFAAAMFYFSGRESDAVSKGMH
ncbi:MAG TPA: iron ABC transporter permease [Devosia sp.]|nr:iron ABC transporter permease [Devosia sp.]